jgi:hypothetical protein
MWTAVIVVGNPLKERAFQVSFGKWNEEVQAFSAGGPHQSNRLEREGNHRI